jgi:hypothetical protein
MTSTSVSHKPKGGRKHCFSFTNFLLLHFHKAYEDCIRIQEQLTGEQGEGGRKDASWQRRDSLETISAFSASDKQAEALR